MTTTICVICPYIFLNDIFSQCNYLSLNLLFLISFFLLCFFSPFEMFFMCLFKHVFVISYFILLAFILFRSYDTCRLFIPFDHVIISTSFVQRLHFIVPNFIYRPTFFSFSRYFHAMSESFSKSVSKSSSISIV